MKLGISLIIVLAFFGKIWDRPWVMGYCLNRLDEPFSMAVPTYMLTEFAIPYRWESCDWLKIVNATWPTNTPWVWHIPQGIGAIANNCRRSPWCWINIPNSVHIILAFSTASLGVASANNPTKCHLITLMVVSILSALFAIPNITFNAIAVDDLPSYYGWIHIPMAIFTGLSAIFSIAMSGMTCCCHNVYKNGNSLA